jgi:hypothetical protein
MNTQNKTIKEILSLYNVILENKNVNEASDVYDDVDFENIGQGNPASDNINTSLLQDVQSAAKSAGLKVNITTAVSGHDKGTRHETGDAVDVARINGIGSGGATNSTNGNAKFRELGNKLKDALVSMGYVWNTESGNPKAVLWQTNTGGNHFNHVHISNTTSTPSKVTGTPASTDTTTDTDTTTGTEPSSFARDIGRSLLQSIGIKESLDYNSLGKKIIVRSGEAIIPKENNSSIKSPVFGVVSSYLNSCNGLTIEFKDDNKISYLNYCGITTKNFRYGQEISKGDVIGYPESDSDVRVTLYNSKGRKERINSNKTSDSSGGIFSLFKTKGNTSKTTNNTTNYNSNNYSQYDSETGKTLIQLKDKLFRVNKKDKLEENINRIKNLL